MAELDHLWASLLDSASRRAVESGRHDIADFIRLKLANDTIRSAGVKWLVDSLIEIAADASRRHPKITIERVEPHSFSVGTSNMVGSLLQVRYGVRCIELEAGWVRTPSDGIMRNGALAHARIRHFGISRNNADFRLVRADPLPVWLDSDEAELTSQTIRRHFDLFLSG